MDQPRFLGRTHGYSDRPTVDPVEAVSADEQNRQSQLAHRRAEVESRLEWVRSKDAILVELDHLREVFGSFISSDLRVIRHQVDKLDSRIRTR